LSTLRATASIHTLKFVKGNELRGGEPAFMAEVEGLPSSDAVITLRGAGFVIDDCGHAWTLERPDDVTAALPARLREVTE